MPGGVARGLPCFSLLAREGKPVTDTLIEPFIDSEDVARLTGLSIRTIWRMARDGRLPPSISPTNRRFRWRRADIDAWLSARPADPLADLLKRAAALAPAGPVREWLLKMSQEGETVPPPAA
jgi:excisionase family DNA binding protein